VKLTHSQRRTLCSSRRAQVLGRRLHALRAAADAALKAYEALAGAELAEGLAADLLRISDQLTAEEASLASELLSVVGQLLGDDLGEDEDQ
jgi:hypothetical protein